MRLYELDNLRVLHNDMKEKGKTRTAFPITLYSRPFSCIFLADIKPLRLYLITPGPRPVFFEIEVFRDYCVSYVIVDFKLLVKYLGLSSEEQKQFTQEVFLRTLNGKLADHLIRLPVYSEVVRAASVCRDIEDEGRAYFCGWKRNPEGKDVRYENYEKTRAAFGDEVADLSRRKNISSRWTADKNGEKINLYDDIFSL